jgi:hypothetical protein
MSDNGPARGNATRQRRRREVIVVGAGAVLIVSALTGLRVARTEIELDLQVSQLTFALPTANAIADPLAVTSLGASNLQAIELPRSRLHDGERYTEPSILLAVATVSGRRGSVNLDGLALPAGAEISLRKSRVPGEYELFLNNSRAAIAVSVDGPVHVVIGGRLDETVDFTIPRQVRLVPGLGLVKLDFTMADTSKLALSYQLPIRQLQLSRIDEFTQAEAPVVRSISTIQSGTLYLESIDGAARPLRAGEGLQFRESDGVIRALELGGEHIGLQFVGEVRGMTAGSGSVRRSLMPTWYEWLVARHRLPFLWGTTAYVFGLIMSVLRWWRQDT